MTIDRELMVPTQLKRGWPEIPNYYQADVEWKVQSGVAVPVKYRTTVTVPDEDRQTMELEMEWTSINEEIPGEEFTYSAFLNLPDNPIDVDDLRTRPVFHVGRLHKDGR